jgi:hypothetical protein
MWTTNWLDSLVSRIRCNRTKRRRDYRRSSRYDQIDNLEQRMLLTSVWGDFNGDGYGDLAISERHEGSYYDGAVDVVYGSFEGLDTSVSASHLDSGNAGGSQSEYGRSLAAGDFNNDGIDDLAVGIPRYDVNGLVDAGAIHIVNGTAAGLGAGGSPTLIHQNSASVASVAYADERFGSSLAVGDFNGDGVADLAVGVPRTKVSSKANAGAVNVLFGGNSGLTGSGSQHLHQNTSGVRGGSEANDYFGYSLAAGDFDNNGVDDLAIGVPFEDFNTTTEKDAGMVNVLYGASTGLTVSGDDVWNEAMDTVGDEQPDIGDHYGKSLTTGDFNGDGYADLAIGIPGNNSAAGGVNVVFGTSTGLERSGNQYIDQDSPGIKGGAESGDGFGFSLAAGDFDADGRDDLAIGVPGEDISSNSIKAAGAVNVIYGDDSGISTRDHLWHQNSTGIKESAGNNERFGASVATGDFDGDGWADLVVGVPGEYDNSDWKLSAVNVLYGSSTGTSSRDMFIDEDSFLYGLPFLITLGGGAYVDSGGQLVIQGTAADDVVTVTGAAAGLGFVDLVWGSGDVDSFVGVSSILFNGYSGNDRFVNLTNRISKALGGDGNDSLYGGGGVDHLEGGNGDDSLYGAAGDDYLYGNAGLDGIFGGLGYDRMWGGGAFGDGYADRFLDHAEESNAIVGTFPEVGVTHASVSTSDGKKQRREADALVTLSGGVSQYADSRSAGTPWTWYEVQMVDQALARMHNSTQATSFLRTPDNRGLVIHRNVLDPLGNDDPSIVGNVGRAHSNGHITLYNSLFTGSNNNWVQQIVIHEVAHFWQGSSYANSIRSIDWRSVPDADAESGDLTGVTGESGLWVRSAGDPNWVYRPSGDFICDYAKTAWNEEFACLFAAQFMGSDWGGRSGMDTTSPGIQDKLNIMTDLVFSEAGIY